MIDAATLHDLSDVAMGDATITTRAALFEWGVTLLAGLIWGDLDKQGFIDQTEDLLQSVALLDDERKC